MTALFYIFTPQRVPKALPANMEIASPASALRARQDSAVAKLRRYGLTDNSVATAAELAGKAARSAPLDWRPMFAASLALPWPSEPLARLWRATTMHSWRSVDGSRVCALTRRRIRDTDASSRR